LFHQVECQAWQFEADAATTESHSCQPTSELEPQVASSCSQGMSKICEIPPVPTMSPRCPTTGKPRTSRVLRVRKRRLGSQNAGLKVGLTKTLASKALSLRETLHGLVSPHQNLATGAA
jgi:hypothetical protein